MSDKDEIKSRLDLVEIIREYVPLKAVGVNFTARCPFHREKTPSFIVSPERQIWRCFGCQKGGDVFSFVMEMEGLSFIEALRQLAPKAGVQLQRYSPGETSKRNRLLDIMDLAVRYFYKLLTEAPEAKPALDYLRGRGLSEKTIEEWQIGYSRDYWDDLLNFLKNKNFSEQEIFLAGLAVKKDRGAGYYDRFRGRIMFPINDYSGNPVAFSARVSPEKEEVEKMGKYINSPQTPIYDKSKILFGLDKAKQYIREEEKAIVAEGQMDVISSHQAGIKNAVASSGTALSPDQIKLIKRYTANVLFSFDMDAAGQIAAERGIAQALEQDMNIKVIQIPGGKDPDECIKNNPNDWASAIKNAQSIIDYYFDKVFAELDLNDIANKKMAAGKLLGVIKNIKSPIERDTWLRRLSGAIEVSEQVLREALMQSKKSKQQSVRQPAERNTSVSDSAAQDSRAGSPDRISRTGRENILSESLLALMVKFPAHYTYVANLLKPEIIIGELNQKFYKRLVIYYNKIAGNIYSFNYEHFKAWLKNNIEDEQELSDMEDLVDILVLSADKDFYGATNEAAKAEMLKIISQLKRKYFINKMYLIEKNLAKAEQAKDESAIKENMEEFKEIADEMRSIN